MYFYVFSSGQKRLHVTSLPPRNSFRATPLQASGVSCTHCFGTAIAQGLGQPEEEREMFTFIQIFVGLVVGFIGFMHIAENPIQGCSALLLSGFIILAGLDHSHDVNR
jgi:hypothetical protein